MGRRTCSLTGADGLSRLPGKDRMGLRAGEHEGHIGPKPGEHEGHMRPRPGEHMGRMGWWVPSESGTGRGRRRC